MTPPITLTHRVALRDFRELVAEKRAASEQSWADLDVAAQSAVDALDRGDRQAAIDAAKEALDIEEALTGGISAADALCDSLGLTAEEVR